MLSEIKDSEIVVGIVGAVGTNLTVVSRAIETALKVLDYNSKLITLSETINTIDCFEHLNSLSGDEFERVTNFMDAGDLLRERLKSGAAMALLGIAAIREYRKQSGGGYDVPLKKQAYILRSLKRPEEIKELRKIYGNTFILFSVYSPIEERIENLAEKISRSNKDTDSQKYIEKAKDLVDRDDKSGDKKFGQNVQDAFPLGDVFIKMGKDNDMEKEVTRFFQCWFGHPFKSPTRDEFGIHLADAASMRSTDLSRQVGAAILSSEGDVIAVGCNEVPKKGGGIAWEGDDGDFRDYKIGKDLNVNTKDEIIKEVLSKLKDAGWLSDEKMELGALELAQESIYSEGAPIKGTRLASLLEFGRIVHAEMTCLMDAAKRGLSVEGATLYCTTFPCHMCARHIIAAGINRVVFIEPYPKSMAQELYNDIISVDGNIEDTSKVSFEPFVGVSPNKYINMFKKGKRKHDNGYILDWDVDVEKYPRTGLFRPAYLEAELVVAARFFPIFQEKFGHMC